MATKEDLLRMGLIETKPGVFEKPFIDKTYSISEKDWLKKFNSEPAFASLFGDLLISFPVDPIGKPRMTQKDQWKKRDATDRYWELKRQMKQIAEGANFTMPESHIHIVCYMPMPYSWPKKKKEEMNGRPHQQKPDADNILKGIQDALCKEDSYIWDVRISKYWSYKGAIEIYKI